MALSRKITKAREKACPFCGGNVYTYRTDKRLIRQCKDCGMLEILKEDKKNEAYK